LINTRQHDKRLLELDIRKLRQPSTILRHPTPWKSGIGGIGGILQSRILGAVLHGCKTGHFTLRLRVLLNRVLMFMFRPNQEVRAGSRIWLEEEVENFTFHKKTLG